MPRVTTTSAQAVTRPAALQARSLRIRDLAPVDLEVAPGEILAIEGPSGCGKTSLLRALADLDPARGEVSAGGQDRDRVSANLWRRRIVYVASDSAWWGDVVAEHLADPERARELAPALGLAADAVDWPVARLSGGERQRLALLRAMLLDPDVLLLDEPTANLDSDTGRTVEEVLTAIARGGTAIVLVTHDRTQAQRLGASRLVLVASGGNRGDRRP
jgi:putative ABC transport system ATP-binding protein